MKRQIIMIDEEKCNGCAHALRHVTRAPSE
jgi:hypothetical protein